MYVTPIGFVVIPIGFAIFFFRSESLGPLAILLSAFQAASVLNIEGGVPIGLTPYFFVLILIAIRFVPLWLSGRFSFSRSDVALEMTQPLLILAIWAIASAFLLPWLFAGVGVNTPRGGMDSPHTTPLEWSLGNAAQALYVALDTIFVIYLLWCSRERGYFERLVRAFVGSGIIAAMIGAYQYVAHYSGLPYPADFFNSNPGWRQLVSEELSGVWRLAATFSEPSAAGAFFAVWSTLLLFLAADNRGGGGRWAWPLFATGAIMLGLTTSTTGYITGAVVLGLFMWKEFARVFTSGRVSGRGLFSLFLIAGAGVAAFLFIPNLSGLLSKIILQKSMTQSSHDRTATVWEALRITSETYGLGVGLGSNRPSGMLFYISSNLGIPGLVLFASTMWVLYRTMSAALRSNLSSKRAASFLVAAGWATVIELVAMASSGGDITSPLLWVCMALVATGSRALWLRCQEASEPIELPESCRVETLNPLIILREEFIS
jgi:hypothetical protein